MTEHDPASYVPFGTAPPPPTPSNAPPATSDFVDQSLLAIVAVKDALIEKTLRAIVFLNYRFAAQFCIILPMHPHIGQKHLFSCPTCGGNLECAAVPDEQEAKCPVCTRSVAVPPFAPSILMPRKWKLRNAKQWSTGILVISFGVLTPFLLSLTALAVATMITGPFALFAVPIVTIAVSSALATGCRRLKGNRWFCWYVGVTAITFLVLIAPRHLKPRSSGQSLEAAIAAASAGLEALIPALWLMGLLHALRKSSRSRVNL